MPASRGNQIEEVADVAAGIRRHSIFHLPRAKTSLQGEVEDEHYGTFPLKNADLLPP